MDTRLSVGLVLGLLAGALTFPGSAATAGTPGTRVSNRVGTTIVLDVPITLQVLHKEDLDPRPSPRGSGVMIEPAAYFEGAAYSWNEAFMRYRYRRCFQFSLDLTFNNPVVTDLFYSNPEKGHTVWFIPDSGTASWLVFPGDPFTEGLLGSWGWGPPVDRLIGAFIGLGDKATTVDQQVIDRLGDRVGTLIELPKKCLHAQVSIDGTTDVVDAAYVFHSTFHADVAGWAATADDGTVAGSASYAYASFYTDEGECRGNARDDATGEGSDLVIAGHRDGDHVELAVTGEIAVSGRFTNEPRGCGGPVDHAYERTTPIDLPLSADLVDGRFEGDDDTQPGPNSHLHIHTLIEELLAEPEAKPVG